MARVQDASWRRTRWGCRMQDEIQRQLRESAELKRRVAETLTPDIEKAARTLLNVYENGRKTLLCGNGGSAADALHIAAELVGRFQRERRPAPAAALAADSAVLTALANDYGYERVFERQIQALGQKGDALIAISTSGQSRNILLAADAARNIGMRVIALTGNGGGELAKRADDAIPIPSSNTARIQEAHIAVAHILCDLVESRLVEIQPKAKS